MAKQPVQGGTSPVESKSPPKPVGEKPVPNYAATSKMMLQERDGYFIIP